MFQLESVIEGHSQASPASLRAVFLTDMAQERSPETSLAPGHRLEPVHLHGVSDTSLPVYLPSVRGDELASLGRGEAHQYENSGTEFINHGTIGDGYDNARAEAINAFYKTELIRQRGSWRTVEQVELATVEWVWRWNNQRATAALEKH